MSGLCIHIAASVYKSSATGVLKCAMKQGLEILPPELVTFTSFTLKFYFDCTSCRFECHSEGRLSIKSDHMLQYCCETK